MGPSMIRVVGDIASVRSLLTARTTEVITGEGGTTAIRAVKPLYLLAAEGEYLECLPGLEPVIRQHQASRVETCRYHLFDRRDIDPLPGATELTSLPPSMAELVRFINAGGKHSEYRRSGFVVCDGQETMLSLVRFLVTHYYLARILLAVASPKLRAKIWELLNDAGVAVEAVGRASFIDAGARVVIDRPYNLIGAHVEHADLFIAVDAERQVNDNALRVACGARQSFAILRTDVRLTVTERRRLQSAYGFDELHFVAPAQVRREIAVQPVDVRGRAERGASPFEVLRQGVHFGQSRRREVARIARRFERRAVTDACPLVVILAASVEHAAYLARELPGWSVCTGQEALTNDLPRRLRSAFAPDTTVSRDDRLIVTPAAVQGLVWSRVAVLINAACAAGCPPIPGPALAQTMPDHPRLLVVDCVDRWHPVVALISKKRRQAYCQAAWAGVGQTIGQLRLEDFLTKGGQ